MTRTIARYSGSICMDDEGETTGKMRVSRWFNFKMLFSRWNESMLAWLLSSSSSSSLINVFSAADFKENR